MAKKKKSSVKEILSDASYNNITEITAIGIYDKSISNGISFTCNCKDSTMAEFWALVHAVRYALQVGYTKVRFIYDCKSLKKMIDQLIKKKYASLFEHIEFVWKDRSCVASAHRLAITHQRKMSQLAWNS